MVVVSSRVTSGISSARNFFSPCNATILQPKRHSVNIKALH
jgi:hypothetical protein